MIVTQLKGGLANQISCYAAGKSLAKRNSTQVFMDINNHRLLAHFSLHHFNIPQRFYQRPFILKQIWNKFFKKNRYFPLNYYLEKDFIFDPKVLTLPDNSYINGYWVSEHYFENIREELLEELTLKAPLSDERAALLAEIKNSNSVCVHVRRGDFVTNPHTAAFHGACSLSYYQEAIQKMEAYLEAPTFYIFSNDLKWVKENLKLNSPVIFIGGMGHKDIDAIAANDTEFQKVNSGFDANQDYEDFYVMRFCKHFIISNSGFSWWPAWLSDSINKKVIAPKNWLKDPSVKIDNLPTEWEKICNE